MSLTFLSKSLSRTLSFADLDALSPAEARGLLGELHIALSSMKDSLDKAKAAGDPDPDWVHSITKKHRICSAFQEQVSLLVERKTGSDSLSGPTTYQQVFQAAMHAEFKRELGSVYEQILQDAHEVAINKLKSGSTDINVLGPVPAGIPAS